MSVRTCDPSCRYFPKSYAISGPHKEDDTWLSPFEFVFSLSPFGNKIFHVERNCQFRSTWNSSTVSQLHYIVNFQLLSFVFSLPSKASKYQLQQLMSYRLFQLKMPQFLPPCFFRVVKYIPNAKIQNNYELRIILFVNNLS